jgi:hypothetical protein
MDEQPPKPLPRASAVARAPALFVTNALKVTGLVIGAHECFTQRDPVVIGFSAFLIAGGQISEEWLMAFINSFFGRTPPDKEKDRYEQK